MSMYDKALKALEDYAKDKTLPPKFDKTTGEGSELNSQIQALADELQNDIDEAQSQLDAISNFEQAWDKLK